MSSGVGMPRLDGQGLKEKEGEKGFWVKVAPLVSGSGLPEEEELARIVLWREALARRLSLCPKPDGGFIVRSVKFDGFWVCLGDMWLSSFVRLRFFFGPAAETLLPIRGDCGGSIDPDSCMVWDGQFHVLAFKPSYAGRLSCKVSTAMSENVT